MRYSAKVKYRKYVNKYGFLLFARKFNDKYGKTLMNNATKTGLDAAKTTSKRQYDLIGNEIVGKITSVGKIKKKRKRKKKKRQQMINELRFFNTI